MEKDAAAKKAAYDKMIDDMTTYVGFACDNKGLNVQVFKDVFKDVESDAEDQCTGSPNAEYTAKWGKCQKVNDEISIIVTKPGNNNFNEDPTGATTVRVASIALIALIGS